MAILSNRCEGAHGTPVTVANSSTNNNGDPWTVVNLTPTYNSGAAFRLDVELSGIRLANPGTTTPYMQWTWATASDTTALRFYFRTSLAATTAYELVSWRNAASSTAGQVLLTSTNRLQVQVTGPGAMPAATNALVANTYYRVEVALNRTAKTYRLAYYLGDSTTPVQDTGVLSTGATAWTNQFAQMRIGKTSTGAFTGNWDYDDVAVDTAAATLLGPSLVAAAPYKSSQFMPFFQ